MTSIVSVVPSSVSTQPSTLSTLSESPNDSDDVAAVTQPEAAPVTETTNDEEAAPVLASDAETSVPSNTDGPGSLVDITV